MQMDRKKILIADDDPALTECLEVLLRLSDYEVFVAYDGEDAVLKARSLVPDLILMDMLMPRVNGFDACKIIKGDRALEQIPLIALTSLAQMGDIEKAYAAGADDYLHKPFENKRLLQKLKKYLT